MHRICIIYNVLFISDIQRTALDLKIRPRWGNNPCTYFIIIQEEASLPNVYPKVRKRKMAKLKKWQIKWSTNWASFQRKMLQSHQKGSNSQFSVCRCGSVWNINLLIKKRGWSVSTNSSVLLIWFQVVLWRLLVPISDRLVSCDVFDVYATKLVCSNGSFRHVRKMDANCEPTKVLCCVIHNK